MVIDPTVVGYVAAFCTTCSFVPQVIHTLKTRDTRSISLAMYATFVFGVAMWLLYGLLVGDFPIIVANTVTICLASTVLFMKVRNEYFIKPKSKL